jgi:phage terminase large subunit-like protein
MGSVDRVREFIHSRPRIAKDVIARLFNDDDKTKNDLLHDWGLWARPEQQFPIDPLYTAILLLCGRGWGKSHWLSNAIIDDALSAPNRRLLLMAADYNNLKKVNFLGDSGIISCINPNIEYEFNKADLSLTFENNSQIVSYSAEAYDKTRGSQFHNAYLDELASWQYAEEGLEAARLVLRLGEHPRLFVATTPRPTAVVKDLAKDERTFLVKGLTSDNYFLPPSYYEELKRKLTDRMFRQECLAEILDDNPYALWNITDIDAARVNIVPHLKRIVVAVDPAVTSNEDSDETGIVVCGIDADGHGYVLDDCTMTSATPDQWAKRTIEAYYKWGANRIVAEVNQGGDLVETVIRNIDRKIPPVKKVRATKGKELRAEPIAAFYERREVHHVGRFTELERQQTEWNPTGKGKSPDRIDALVWGLTELMTKPKMNYSVSNG